ncbi:unnamed protein product [Rotaria sp. Silwood2]|nr:unnamed protein product [Rotaria sp. Silwood2]
MPLTKPKVKRIASNSPPLEPPSLPDFLVPFVNQVEFIAKHPILAMFYADGLCLGICNSARAAEIMRKLTDIDSPIVGIRLNSIKVDYKAIASTVSASKSIKATSCAVRVDIYNDRTKKLQYRTFNSSILALDIRKFVTTAYTENGNHIRILSNLNDSINVKNYKSFKDFDKYYSERLTKIYQINEDYKLITNILNNVEDGDDDDDDDNHQGIKSPNSNLCEMFPENLLPPPSAATYNNEYCSNVTTIYDDISKVNTQSNTNQTTVQNILSTSSQQSFQHINNQDMIEYVLSQPEIIQELLHRLGVLQISSTILPTPQEQGYQNLHLQQSLPTSFQMQSSYQQPSLQMQYQQSQQQLYNQQYFQQLTPFSSMGNQLNNQYQNFSNNSIQMSPQQCLPEIVNEDLFAELIPDSHQFQTIDQVN